jgi:hypothetical protein
MYKLRIETCKICSKSFETRAPSASYYCSINCKATAKHNDHKLYKRYSCKACKTSLGRIKLKEGQSPPEFCDSCYIAPKEKVREKQYTCQNCGIRFKALSKKEFCTYTCKSQTEKVLNVVWITQPCVKCNRTEKMQEWRIEINGGLCTKCTEQEDQKKNTYASLRAKRKVVSCATCINSVLDSRSESGYICKTNAAVCKPYAEAKSYAPRFPK